MQPTVNQQTGYLDTKFNDFVALVIHRGGEVTLMGGNIRGGGGQHFQQRWETKKHKELQHKHMEWQSWNDQHQLTSRKKICASLYIFLLQYTWPFVLLKLQENRNIFTQMITL